MTQGQKPSKQTLRGRLWARTGFGNTTVWDWLQLLILPIALTVAGLWFSAQQDQRQQANEEQRTQDLALESYIADMSELMIHNGLNSSLTRSDLLSEETNVTYRVAQTRTATVLVRLDSSHNKSVIRFLNAGGLTGISGTQDPISIFWNIDLRGVDFRGINLSRASLWNADLIGADLAEANLSSTILTDADLTNADLTDANLTNANLSDWTANINEAEANIAAALTISPEKSGKGGADLTNADLTNADLTDANLTDANLKEVDLTSADLSNAIGITGKSLEEQAASLEGATMPNGQKYADWNKNPLPTDKNIDNTLPASGSLRVGKYDTEEFEPAFHFEVGEGWQVFRTETADQLSIETEPTGGWLIIANPPAVVDPSTLSEDRQLNVAAPETPDEWVSWFQKHPYLETSKPVPVRVGGASGVAIDVTDISPPEKATQYCGGTPCVLLLSTSSDQIFVTAELKSRFVIVDIGKATVVIDQVALADAVEEFLPKTQKVLDTVKWQE